MIDPNVQIATVSAAELSTSRSRANNRKRRSVRRYGQNRRNAWRTDADLAAILLLLAAGADTVTMYLFTSRQTDWTASDLADT
jgi:hypothetical protein